MVGGIKHDIARFEISVDDLLGAEVLKSDHDLSCHVLRKCIVE